MILGFNIPVMNQLHPGQVLLRAPTFNTSDGRIVPIERDNLSQATFLPMVVDIAPTQSPEVRFWFEDEQPFHLEACKDILVASRDVRGVRLTNAPIEHVIFHRNDEPHHNWECTLPQLVPEARQAFRHLGTVMANAVFRKQTETLRHEARHPLDSI